jgi:hypothetical protein
MYPKEELYLEEARLGKYGSTPCEQERPSAILVRGDVAKSVKQIRVGTTLQVQAEGEKVSSSGTFTFTSTSTSTFTLKYLNYR